MDIVRICVHRRIFYLCMDIVHVIDHICVRRLFRRRFIALVILCVKVEILFLNRNILPWRTVRQVSIPVLFIINRRILFRGVFRLFCRFFSFCGLFAAFVTRGRFLGILRLCRSILFVRLLRFMLCLYRNFRITFSRVGMLLFSAGQEHRIAAIRMRMSCIVPAVLGGLKCRDFKFPTDRVAVGVPALLGMDVRFCRFIAHKGLCFFVALLGMLMLFVFFFSANQNTVCFVAFIRVGMRARSVQAANYVAVVILAILVMGMVINIFGITTDRNAIAVIAFLCVHMRFEDAYKAFFGRFFLKSADQTFLVAGIGMRVLFHCAGKHFICLCRGFSGSIVTDRVKEQCKHTQQRYHTIARANSRVYIIPEQIGSPPVSSKRPCLQTMYLIYYTMFLNILYPPGAY